MFATKLIVLAVLVLAASAAPTTRDQESVWDEMERSLAAYFTGLTPADLGQLSRLESAFAAAFFGDFLRDAPVEAVAAAVPDVIVAFRQVVFEAVLLHDFDQRDVTSYLYSVQDEVMGPFAGPIVDSVRQFVRDGLKKDVLTGQASDKS